MCGLCRCSPAMCTTSTCDLEEIPLDDDDSNSMEFKILEFYVTHHVFKNSSAVFSPKLLRTRSLSQKGPGSWPVKEAWTQGPWPCRSSQSSEKAINLAKKKSSWRTLFGVAEKEENSQSVPTGFRFEGPRRVETQSGSHSQQWPRSLSNVEQRLEHEGRLLGIFSLLHPSFPSLCAWEFTSSQVSKGVLGRALSTTASQLGNIQYNFPTFLKIEQKERWWQ